MSDFSQVDVFSQVPLDCLGLIMSYTLQPFIPDDQDAPARYDPALRLVVSASCTLRTAGLLHLASSIKAALSDIHKRGRASLRFATWFLLGRDTVYSDDASEAIQLRAQRAWGQDFFGWHPMCARGMLFNVQDTPLHQRFGLVGLPKSVLPTEHRIAMEGDFHITVGSHYVYHETPDLHSVAYPQHLLMVEPAKLLEEIHQSAAAAAGQHFMEETAESLRAVEDLRGLHVCERLVRCRSVALHNTIVPSVYKKALCMVMHDQPVSVDGALAAAGYLKKICRQCLCPLGVNGLHDDAGCRQVCEAMAEFIEKDEDRRMAEKILHDEARKAQKKAKKAEKEAELKKMREWANEVQKEFLACYQENAFGLLKEDAADAAYERQFRLQFASKKQRDSTRTCNDQGGLSHKLACHVGVFVAMKHFLDEFGEENGQLVERSQPVLTRAGVRQALKDVYHNSQQATTQECLAAARAKRLAALSPRVKGEVLMEGHNMVDYSTWDDV